MKRAQKWGLYSSQGSTITDVMDAADSRLFHMVLTNTNHILNSLLPPAVTHTHNLRPRSHNLALPHKTTLLSSNFLFRMLYANSY